MSLAVLVLSVNDCIEAANTRQKIRTSACDMMPDQTIKSLLSLATSMGMLGFKLVRALRSIAILAAQRHARVSLQAHLIVLKYKWEEAKNLEQERQALIAELETSLSPELVDQVRTYLGPRRGPLSVSF